MDSLFYTDDELEIYDNYMVNNDVREMELFLEDCDDFKKDIIALSTSLNNDNLDNLNINLDIYSKVSLSTNGSCVFSTITHKFSFKVIFLRDL